MNPHAPLRHPVQSACICFKSSRFWASSSRTRFCSATASAEYCPCFQRDRRDRARPSAVRGPVLAPPYIRHRKISAARLIAPPLLNSKNFLALFRKKAYVLRLTLTLRGGAHFRLCAVVADVPVGPWRDKVDGPSGSRSGVSCRLRPQTAS
jgi:hypothetical protein